MCLWDTRLWKLKRMALLSVYLCQMPLDPSVGLLCEKSEERVGGREPVRIEQVQIMLSVDETRRLLCAFWLWIYFIFNYLHCGRGTFMP